MADKLATHLEVIRIFGTPCTRAESFVYIYLSNRDLYRVLSDTHLSRSYAGIVLRFDSFKFVEYTTAHGSSSHGTAYTVDAETHVACAADPQTAHKSFHLPRCKLHSSACSVGVLYIVCAVFRKKDRSYFFFYSKSVAII